MKLYEIKKRCEVSSQSHSLLRYDGLETEQKSLYYVLSEFTLICARSR